MTETKAKIMALVNEYGHACYDAEAIHPSYIALEAAIDDLVRERDELQGHCDRLSGMKFSDRMHSALLSRARNAEAALSHAASAEPVAWILTNGDSGERYLTFGKPEHYKGTPLYSHPAAQPSADPPMDQESPLDRLTRENRRLGLDY